MPYEISYAERWALYDLWGGKCVWCNLPLFWSDYEVEHLIPKHLASPENKEKRREALTRHGLPSDYDLYAIENLAPSCGPCNSGKGRRIPTLAPAITELLNKAQKLAPKVRKKAAAFAKKRDTEKALAMIMASDDIEQLKAAADFIQGKLKQASESLLARVHPALSGLYDPKRWNSITPLSADVAFVADGKTGGVTGKHISWQCPHCSSYGPWNGNRCLTCGQMDVPDW
ncbi:HNH endonuclease [Streptomyces pilosus]|uniref:HNH endonuclease n=1 Tax=Streptomyces pilosus TaxID=28893 RepID=A0A918BRJ7_9ACTN|nr:HNH endonuclease [Streptomyces pilosus]GGQ88010.1 hypothetical protein GCM10010280_38680 [Streptomyces pilosus]